MRIQNLKETEKYMQMFEKIFFCVFPTIFLHFLLFCQERIESNFGIISFSSNSCMNWLLKIKVFFQDLIYLFFKDKQKLPNYLHKKKGYFRANKAFYKTNWERKIPQVLCFVYRVKIPQKSSIKPIFFFQSQTFKKKIWNPQKILWISIFERFNQTKRKISCIFEHF